MDESSIHERLNAQDRTLSSIATDVGLLRRELLGNGQPGRLTKVESKVETLEAKQNRAEGFWKGVNWLKAAIVVAVAEGIRYFTGHRH